jgi:hypothetical protein
MNERDIELAKKAGWEYAHGESGFEPLWKFADLIRADEREEILKLADSLGWVNVDDIRARGQA